jgi:hypothetical protein
LLSDTSNYLDKKATQTYHVHNFELSVTLNWSLQIFSKLWPLGILWLRPSTFINYSGNLILEVGMGSDALDTSFSTFGYHATNSLVKSTWYFLS